MVCAALVKGTFLHVEAEVDSEGSTTPSSSGWRTPDNSQRRASSQPPSFRGACSPGGQALVLYVNNGSGGGWQKVDFDKKVSSDAVSTRPIVPELLLALQAESPQHAGGPAYNGEATCFGGVSCKYSAPEAKRPWLACGAEVAPKSRSCQQQVSAQGGLQAGTEGKPAWTTVMMRNLPKDYSRDLVRDLLDQAGFGGKYDFVYVPYDFNTRAIMGFAFVNLISPQLASEFRKRFAGFRSWGTSATGKVCNVSWANVDQQGLRANIERYRNSSVMHKTVLEDWKPLLLVKGAPVKFPKSTKQLWTPHADFGRRARANTR